MDRARKRPHLDRLAIVETRLDLIDERLTNRDHLAMSADEARRRHQQHIVAAFTVGFVAIVAALTALGYALIEAFR